ncbi:MAG TPA: hemerythrin domain-containing protein [bacterium]|nr:hemerythrin domain-containing protein [bacterium]
MKRHEALIPLSDEHHQGLIWSKRFREMPSDMSADETRDLVNEFMPVWHSEINPHFQKEEQLLLPLFARTGVSLPDSVPEMLEQHIFIRRDVLLLRDSPGVEIMVRLGSLLQDHIRLEERDVFPFIERESNNALLTRIGQALRSEDA